MSAERRERDTGNWAPGTVLAGRYEILRRLGEGDVYAAFDRELEANIAVRRVPRPSAGDPEALERLKRELLLARAFSHPNLCRIYDWHTAVGSGGEEHFLTMELLDGEALADWLRRRRRAPRRWAYRWLQEVAAGLDAAHAAGVVHGKLEPASVILAGSSGDARGELRRAVITGFGQAVPGAARASDRAAFGQLARHLLGRDAAAMAAACLAPEPNQRPPSAAAALALLPARYRRERPPRAPWRRRWQWRRAAPALAAAALVALCISLLRYYEVRSEVPMGASILLTPLVNATGQAEFDGAAAALRQQLAQSSQFELLDAGQTRQALARMAQPANLALTALAKRPALAREVAMRADAPLVVFGELSRLAGRYRLDIELERVGNDPDAPARRWSDAETAAGPDGVFQALHAAADWVRRRAGEPDAQLAAADRPPQDITTSSWLALALYARAEEERAAGNTAGARALLHAALQDDPGFALAYVRLGDEQNPEDLSGTSFTDYRRAMSLARSGRRLSQRELLRLEGDYDLDVGDERAAATSFAAYSALYPGDYLGWFYQAYPDVASGAPARAEAALERAQTLRPESEAVAGNRAYVELWRGETGAAQREVARMDRLPGARPDADLMQGLVDIAQGEERQAVRAFAAAAGATDPYRRTLAPRLEADALAEMGEDARAEALLRATLTRDAAIETPSGVAEVHLDLAYLQMQTGRRAAAGRECGAAIAAYASPHVLVEAGTMLARMGDLAAARRALAALAPFRDQRPAVTIDAGRLEGEIRLAQGDAATAVALLRRAAGLSDALDDREYLAHALAAAGHPRQAERLYAHAAVAARVWRFSEPALPGWYADLAFQAARLSQQLGLAGARARWEQYLQLRAHADAGLPGVRYARQALRHTEVAPHE